jgi:pimeloyl-ACP methyl ester carboxylesterase/DNA-binding SARP family transcriptional activator
VRISLLGPVELRDEDGSGIEVTSRRQRQLLAVLALRRGATVSVDRIAELLWGDEAPTEPSPTVQTNISRLRRLLRHPIEVATAQGGYRLTCPPGAVDVGHFEDLVARLRRSAPADGVELAAEALALWRGVPFPDLDHPDLEAERQRLHELRLETLEMYADGLCDRGRHGEAIEVAEAHTREHRHRERSVATLMRSFYATGRQVEALQAFAQLRRRLLDDLGVDPSPPLQELELAILHQRMDSALLPGSTSAASSGSPSPVGSPKRQRLEQQIRFCTADGGTRIAYATSGEGPVIVKAANWMTHVDGDWESPVWRHWLEALSDGRRLVRYDERGCGLSDWDVDRFTFDAWVDDLEMVVDALGLDRFPLLGISQGGAVAIAYAVRHPDRVSALVLCGAYGRGRLVRAATEEQRREAALHLELARVGWGSDDPAFRQVFTSQFMPDGTLEQWAAFNELQRRTTSPENAVRFMEIFGDIDVTGIAPEVRCPTLLLHSRGDLRVPLESARELATLIPDSRLVLLPSRNHILGADEPAWQLFLDELNIFLAAAYDSSS